MEGKVLVLTKSFLNHAASVLFVCLLCCTQAQGAVPTTTWQECGGPSVMESVPLTVDVGQDVEIGDVLGQWTRVEVVRWDCVARATIGFVQHGEARTYMFFPGVTVWGTISLGGFPYTVYKTIHNGKSIGFIVRIMTAVNDINYVMTDFGGYFFNQNPAEQPIAYTTGNSLDNGESVFYTAGLVARLVKISNDFPLDNSELISLPVQISLRTERRTNATWQDASENPPVGGVIANPSHLSWDQHVSHSANVPVDIRIVNATCQFHGQPVVPLGNRSINTLQSFNEPLSSLNFPVTFFVRAINCPKYMAGVHFSFAPMPSNPYAANGILTLVPPSTATGVGVQIFSSVWNNSINDYEPVPLQFGMVKEIPLPNLYESVTTMIGMVMYARMVRLHPSISPSPGTVHAAMKATLRYK